MKSKLKIKQFSYQILSINPLQVHASTGESNFVVPVTQSCSKVYVVSEGRNIVYVGSSTQPIRQRIYGALNAKGENGYYGPGYKGGKLPLNLDIWILEGIKCPKGKRCTKAETLEAEVVFLVRQRKDNWPKYQTEIHFHKSSKEERRSAEAIYNQVVKRI